MRVRKINVTTQRVVNRHGREGFKAVAVYYVDGIKRRRTVQADTAAAAALEAKHVLLDALEAEGIDPECVETERMLTRERSGR
jgi:hypothetical protein